MESDKRECVGEGGGGGGVVEPIIKISHSHAQVTQFTTRSIVFKR